MGNRISRKDALKKMGNLALGGTLLPGMFLSGSSAKIFPSNILSINKTDSLSSLNQAFRNPPRLARPWVYWVWLANTTTTILRRDLKAIKAKGIVGCILYANQTGIGGNFWKEKVDLIGKKYIPVPTDDFRKSHFYTPIPTGKLAAWSSRWRKLIRFAAGECNRLGIDLVLSNGLANTSADIPEEYGEQKLDWTERFVNGPQTFDETLSEPKLQPQRGDFPHPKWKPFYRDVAVLAVPNRTEFSAKEVINLTDKMNADGHLHWAAPKGSWKIIRFVQVPTGAHNQWGYFNDSLSVAAMNKTWDVTMSPLLKEMTPAERSGLKGIEDDSWESGITTWTKLFPEEFRKRRGYDLIPWLPVIAGLSMSDAVTRARVLRDYKLTISDLIANNHYGQLRKLANESGLLCYAEAAGPNYSQADLLKTSSRVDFAMAEFWVPSAHRASMDRRYLLRNAANANHIYGQNITMCESFTSLGPEWDQTPFTMKPVGDQAFCDGLNRISFHNFSQSPSLTAKPGYVYVAGTHYDPGITWWNETPAFNLYLARCSAMLQAGRFFADAIIYRGDNIGHGEQRKTILPTLGEGYDHDNCNSEVLLTRMSVRNGRITLKDGMSYRVLVLPERKPMPLEDLRKVKSLVEAGATVVGSPPTRMSGMPIHPNDEKDFNDLVTQLWGGLNGAGNTRKQIGAGQIVWGETARAVLVKSGALPDFQVKGVSDEGTIDWIHRKTKDADIYFVASHWAHPEDVVCTFRVSGKQPELWNPVTGEIRKATAFRQENGRTHIPLQFDPCGSIFVVFEKTIPANVNGTTESNYPNRRVLKSLSGSWTVNFDPKWGGPKKTVFKQLIDWTKSNHEGIKYYSGSAVYHKQFDWNGKLADGEQLWLDLGKVYDLATVWVNGQNLGVIWTKPAQVDITKVVKSGKNNLEIRVVNLWPNRLIRDSSLPQKSRLTETNIHNYSPDSPLLPSGLVGPVSLLSVRES